jgi:hypothetical protein
MILTKGIYGYNDDPKTTPFGLLNNQIKSSGIINNAGWYNFDGERLGRGDLSAFDMQKISKWISKDEFFIILNEFASVYNVPEGLDSSAPGTDYVMGAASWVIVSGNIFRIRDDADSPELNKKNGIEYIILTRKKLFQALNYSKTTKKVAEKTEEPVVKTKSTAQIPTNQQLKLLWHPLIPPFSPAPFVLSPPIGAIGPSYPNTAPNPVPIPGKQTLIAPKIKKITKKP